MNNMTDAVKQLLIINVLCFLGSFVVPQSNDLLALYYFESDKISYIKTIGALSLALAFIVALINKLKHNDSSK